MDILVTSIGLMLLIAASVVVLWIVLPRLPVGGSLYQGFLDTFSGTERDWHRLRRRRRRRPPRGRDGPPDPPS